MRVKNLIKNYPATIIFTIILASNLIILVTPQKVLASFFLSKANPDCQCKNIELCPYNYTFAENGRSYPCYKDDYSSLCLCADNAPYEFIHCDFPVVERCTRMNGCGCECEESDCDHLFSTLPCRNCYKYIRADFNHQCLTAGGKCIACNYRVSDI